MASIHHQVAVGVDVKKAWRALRSVGEAHRLFAPVLTDTKLEGDTRTVTFANGMILRERILDVDDKRHRVAYSALDAPGMTYHHATMELVDTGDGRCLFVWVTDFLPEEIRGNIAPLVEQGTDALKANLEQKSTARAV